MFSFCEANIQFMMKNILHLWLAFSILELSCSKYIYKDELISPRQALIDVDGQELISAEENIQHVPALRFRINRHENSSSEEDGSRSENTSESEEHSAERESNGGLISILNQIRDFYVSLRDALVIFQIFG